MRCAERNRRRKIIDHLRDDAREVDRIDAGEPHTIAECMMIEQALHDRLAIVERTLNRERMYIRRIRRRHHAALHVGHAAMRIEHDQVGLRAVAKCLDCGAAGVAGGRDDDRRALAAARQHMIHQPREQLHREIFECERRPVRQLQHETVVGDLHQRRHRRMAERAVGLVRHARQISPRNRIADKRRDDLDRDLGIRTARQRSDRIRATASARFRARRGRRRGPNPRA